MMGGMEDAAPSLPKIRFRRLRIAWSLLAAAACIWLVAFWVRSFWFVDSLDTADGHRSYYEFASTRGEFTFRAVGDAAPWDVPLSWHHYVELRLIPANILGFHFSFGANDFLMIPYWFVLFITVGMAILPWMRWSFGLRTMLIAVTVIAALLGLARLATFSDAPAAESSATFD
jgi:hypothetical protein